MQPTLEKAAQANGAEPELDAVEGDEPTTEPLGAREVVTPRSKNSHSNEAHECETVTNTPGAKEAETLCPGNIRTPMLGAI